MPTNDHELLFTLAGAMESVARALAEIERSVHLGLKPDLSGSALRLQHAATLFYTSARKLQIEQRGY